MTNEEKKEIVDFKKLNIEKGFNEQYPYEQINYMKR